MKRIVCFAFCLGCLLAGQAVAGHGHYTNGGEGIKVASLPPPGTYWKMYNVFYTADEYRDHRNKRDKHFSVDVFAMVNRFLYVSDVRLLGGNISGDISIPLIYTDISPQKGFSKHKFGLGDILLQPAYLAWHGERWDAVAGPGVYLPVGSYDEHQPASPGKGFWTLLLSAGGTYYLGDDKSWNISSIVRYEIHSKQDDTHIRYGDDLMMEWGIGKVLSNGWEVGLAGFGEWQVKKDSGRNAQRHRHRAYGFGPEVIYTHKPSKLSFSLRFEREFSVRTGTRGNIATLSITRPLSP